MRRKQGIRPIGLKVGPRSAVERLYEAASSAGGRAVIAFSALFVLFGLSVLGGAGVGMYASGGGCSDVSMAAGPSVESELEEGAGLGMGGPLEPLAGDSLGEESHESLDLDIHTYTIAPDDNLYTALQCMGVPGDVILAWCDLAKDKYNLAYLKPGQTLNLYTNPEKEFTRFELNVGNQERLVISKEDTGYLAAIETFDGEVAMGEVSNLTRTRPLWVDPETGFHYYRGKVESTFYEAATKAGMTPNKVMSITRVFGSVNFDRDITPGSSFSVVVAPGESAKDEGPLLAVLIEIGGKKHFVFRHESGERWGYYDEDGNSTRRRSLICPVRYARISSGYTHRRYHPVLGGYRPHLGVDYAARTGTPVKAAADGVVEFVGRKGGFGKTVLISHDGGMKTQYGHLSGYGSGIRKGKKVSQGQVIGYVGATGLATGPHLDYRVYKNGKPVNPLMVTGIPSPPVADKKAYKATVGKMTAELEKDLPMGPARPWTP